MMAGSEPRYLRDDELQRIEVTLAARRPSSFWLNPASILAAAIRRPRVLMPPV